MLPPETHLEEQHKRHPLVVAVEDLLLVVVAQTAGRYFSANMFAMLPGQRERIRYPTVCVQHMVRYGAIVDARNWVA